MSLLKGCCQSVYGCHQRQLAQATVSHKKSKVPNSLSSKESWPVKVVSNKQLTNKTESSSKLLSKNIILLRSSFKAIFHNV